MHNIDLKTKLYLRLFCLAHTAKDEIFQRERERTSFLLQNLASFTTKEETGFLFFFEQDGSVYESLLIPEMEEISSIEPPSRTENMKLYRYNFDGKNELISRNNGKNENERLKYLLNGYYFLAHKINTQAEELYYVTDNIQKEYFKYKKYVAGKYVELLQRKNEGKIYRLINNKDIPS